MSSCAALGLVEGVGFGLPAIFSSYIERVIGLMEARPPRVWQTLLCFGLVSEMGAVRGATPSVPVERVRIDMVCCSYACGLCCDYSRSCGEFHGNFRRVGE